MHEENTIPVWSGNFHPFHLVLLDGEEWSPTLDEVNTNAYDKEKLFRSSFNIDVGIAPFSLITIVDGTLVVPMCKEIPKSKALSLFNSHLTNLLLGGLLVHEVAPDDVNPGSLNLWGYHRHHHFSGRYSKFSQCLRTGQADSYESIILVEPRTIEKKQYLEFQVAGASVSKNLHPNFPIVFLPSTTAFCEEKWERALILGWSAIELLIEKIWVEKIYSNANVEGIKQKRRKDFLSDTRTWSSSTRIELLWQRGMLSDELYALVDQARAARNSFIHSANVCAPEDARSAIEASLRLVDTIAVGEGLSFDFARILKMLDEATEKFRSPRTDERGRLLEEPRYWRKIDPAPGFKDWGDRPFEKMPEIELKPLEVKTKQT